ncbi:hypothetical protein Ancab_026412 [Ancistrocladus abbreviatus]
MDGRRPFFGLSIVVSSGCWKSACNSWMAFCKKLYTRSSGLFSLHDSNSSYNPSVKDDLLFGTNDMPVQLQYAHCSSYQWLSQLNKNVKEI